MKLQFLGAARQVTGSQYYFETNGTRILVDCGMYQERDFLERNWNAPPFRPRDIDVVLLTHAHIDHCGLLPKLVADGFHGKILATAPTCELVDILLRDSAQIQAEDAEFKEKRHRKEGREGRYPVKPLYTLRDVERTLPLLESVSYHETVRLGENASAVFHEAGHILGAAIVELIVEEHDVSRRVVFSGDLGMPGKPFVRSPDQLTEADWLVVESTYGDRDHVDDLGIEDQLAGGDQRDDRCRRQGDRADLCRGAGPGADLLPWPPGPRRAASPASPSISTALWPPRSTRSSGGSKTGSIPTCSGGWPRARCCWASTG